jgi:hypothetical protein
LRRRTTRLEDAIALDPDPRLRLAIWGGVPLGLFLLGVAATGARRRAARQKADAA